MDGKQVNRSMNQRKTSYFEKYRRDLEKITDEMKKSDKIIKNVNISEPEIKQQKQIPVTFRKITTQSKLLIQNQSQPLKTSIKRLSTKKQEDNTKLLPETTQDLQKIKKQMEGIKQVEQLVAQLQIYNTKNQKADFQLQERRKIIQGLKRRLASGVSEKQYMNNVVNYAEKILLIEQTMKAKKQNHEQQLNKLFLQKNEKHSQNVELSKQVQKLEDEIATLSKSIANVQSQSPTKNIQAISNKLRAEIAKLEHQYEIVLKKQNSNQELKEMSYRQYKKYVEIFTKKFVGRQIALSEDRIKMRNDNKRYLLQIEKKKIQLKQKKVQMMVRKKGVIEMNRIIQGINKEIKQLQGEQKIVHHHSDRKMSFFQKL